MNILWVEDEIQRLSELIKPLTKLGFTVHGTESYLATIDLINSGIQFDLAIVDIIIPHGGNFHPSHFPLSRRNEYLGLEICKKIRTKFPDLPIVVISIVEDPHVSRELAAIGISGFLHKGALMPSEVKDYLMEILESKNKDKP